MKVTCKKCGKEIDTPMYFYNARIEKTVYLPTDPTEYKATTYGKAICLVCGEIICENFSTIIHSSDIVRLAVGKKENDMTRYTDIAALLSELPDDLPYKASVKRVLIQAPAADVVSKSEVERLQDELDLYGFVYGVTPDKQKVTKKVKAEVAREIIKAFKELLQPYEIEFKKGNVTIENLHCCPSYKRLFVPKYEVDAFFAKLKRKYTEGE